MARLAAAWLDAQKKQVAASERDEEERALWREEHAGLKSARLVFVDESVSNTALALRYGWAPQGERAVGQAPRNRKTTPRSRFAALGLILEGVRQAIAAASPRERRSSWFKLQLAAEARALAEVNALEKGGAQ